jgi:carotenoid cleavage dioxygenase-like enzyme
VWLRIGEWDAAGALATAQSVALERATWQHDVAVTPRHVVFVESPTARLEAEREASVPFGWLPGTEGWLGIVPRGGDGTSVRWFRLDPTLVTHLLGAYEEGAPGSGAGRLADADPGVIVLYVCRYAVPEKGQPVDVSASVVGPDGIGLSAIGGSLAVLERWRVHGDTIERAQLDDRHVEYPRVDAACEGAAFRYGYCVELGWDEAGVAGVPLGLVQFDLARDEVRAWEPGPGRRPSEPLFVRAVDGHSDDEGWVLTVVDDPDRRASDLYVLDASALGRRRPEAVIHLPERLPFGCHGEWVPADRYR